MKILITGAAGLLGSDCTALLSSTHEVAALSSRGFDIADPAAVQEAVARYQPEVILNCAAYAKVDACESDREQAFRVNAAGPRNLALALAELGGKLVHISTDYVFDGQRIPPEPYTEGDPPSPLSCYGQSKLAGEQAIQESTDNFIIVRTAWLYGLSGPNFLKTMLRLALAEEGRVLRVVNDQHGSPTWSCRLAEQLKVLLEAGGRGIYHATAEGRCTWFELAVHFFKQMGIQANLAPITTAEYPTPAVRPKNSILENRRLKEAGLNVMRPWQDDLAEFVEKFRERLRQEAGMAG